MSFYNISQVPERELSALHYHSSLQAPTLENVEARLEAARSKNKQMGRMFFQQKFGSKLAYDSYLASKALTGLIHEPLQEPDFKTKLEIKAREIQRNQTLEIKNKKHKDEFREDNPWVKSVEKGRNTNQEDNQYRQNSHAKYDLKPEESMYLTGFQKYLQNKKSNSKEASKLIQSNMNRKHNNQSISLKKDLKVNSPNKNESVLLKQEGKSKVQQKHYEQQLVRKIFKQILNRQPKRDEKISNLLLVQYFTTHPRILEVLGVSVAQMTERVIQMSDCLDSNDVLILMFDCLKKTKEMRMVIARKENSRIPNGCLLSLETIRKFQSIFKYLDKHNDLIVKRLEFIGALAIHPDIKNKLSKPALYESMADRNVSLRRIFEKIEIEALLVAEPKTLEYISWQQFMKYFQSGRKQRGNYDLVLLIQSLKKEDKFGLSELPQEVVKILKEAICKVDKGQQLLDTLQLIDEIKLHPDYSQEKYTYVRSSEEIPSESLEELLKRIKQIGMKFMHMKEFLQYFSATGKPKEQEKQNHQKKSHQSILDIFSNEQPDGYDSDPEGYQPRKKEALIKEFFHPQPIFQQATLNYAGKITVPIPFSFEERKKESKNITTNQSVQQRAFKARPIPKSVAQVGLYTKMVEEDKKRIQERKKSQMIMSLALQQPFSFENRKIKKKTREQREKYQFKAKPIPWYCSVDLLKRKEEENILKNQKIAKMAQQKLARAKLPPRMEQDQQKRQIKVLEVEKPRPKSASKAKNLPNFAKIHRQFQQELERKRKQNSTTQIKQFKLSQKRPTLKKTTQIYEQLSTKTFQNTVKNNIIAKSTIKYNQQIQKKRKEVEQKRLKEIEKQKQEAARIIVDPQLKKKVLNSLPNWKKIDEKEKEKKQKAEIDAQKEAFKLFKEGCIQRAKKQPLLIDRPSKRDQRKQLKKKLYEISKTLTDNKIIGQMHDKYFKKEELLLLKEEQEQRKLQ